jgi:hypothetical protein
MNIQMLRSRNKFFEDIFSYDLVQQLKDELYIQNYSDLWPSNQRIMEIYCLPHL